MQMTKELIIVLLLYPFPMNSSFKPPPPISDEQPNCEVIPGQLYKRKVAEYLTVRVVDFAKAKPQDRFRKITQS
jgi:hypothetical protein